MYNKILLEIDKCEKDKLFILSIGPTATILASDLCDKGYQAIDLGHIDIEYEWYLMKAIKKVPVKGKFVNETQELGDLSNIILDDQSYRNSIITEIN